MTINVHIMYTLTYANPLHRKDQLYAEESSKI